MGKLFPDGQPHYDPETNKVLKPENWEQDFAPEAKIKAEIQRQLKIIETMKRRMRKLIRLSLIMEERPI